MCQIVILPFPSEVPLFLVYVTSYILLHKYVLTEMPRRFKKNVEAFWLKRRGVFLKRQGILGICGYFIGLATGSV